jgi:two-component system sensor histidine kinase UhpB
MLRHICVAHRDTPGWRAALRDARELARRAGARVSVVHVAAPDDGDDGPAGDAIARELLGVDGHARAHRRLAERARAELPDVETDLRVLAGQQVPQMLAFLHSERPDLVVVEPDGGGTEADRLAGELAAHGPCPVALADGAAVPSGTRPVVLVLPGRGRSGRAVERIAAALARDLGASIVRGRPRRRPTREAARLAAQAAAGGGQPLVCVAPRERLPMLRRMLGLPGQQELVAAAGCPVVVPPKVDEHRTEPDDPVSASHLLTDTQPARAGEAPAERPLPIGRSLLWQLFAADALVLVAALAVLVFAPIRVSTGVVLREVLILSAGLTVILALNLLLLRRALAPLRLLTDVIGTIDPRRPGRRLPVSEARTAEVAALAGAFNAMLDRLETERRESARRALAAQEDERLRIAREMHDELGQTLTALTIQAERAVEAGERVRREDLERLVQTAHKGLDDVRRIGRELRPEALDDLGLGNAVIALCRRTATQSGLRVAHHLGTLPPLRPEVELVVYRVAQEALTNALRHASASRADVSLAVDGDALELVVADDGVGLPEELPDDTAGLSGMRERALLVGGRLSLRSRSRGGTEVHLRIPLEEAVR